MAQDKNKDRTVAFRLQNENAEHNLENTIKGWGKSQMYDDLQINSIESSNKHSLSEPTSIPSPFARIALAKTAFGEVAKNGENASDVYKKIVSDCLDVAEIFFSFDKWEKQLTILKWDKDKDLEDLKTHNFIFYKTLKTFLETDAKAYNFDKMKCIYMLKHNATQEIIGATSPCTLFFSSANPFTGKDIILSNNHKAFSNIFPLSKRSWDFQAYLYATMAQDTNFENLYPELGKYIKNAVLYPEFAKYLEKQETEGNLINRRADIDRIKADPTAYIKKYAPYFSDMTVEILGMPLLKQRTGEEGIIIIDVSDFQIVVWDEELKESVYENYFKKEKKLPLVLPLDGGNSTKYNTWTLTKIAKWNDFYAMTSYEESWSSGKRQLPDGTFFPFLTISDFLTDSIIQLPYKLNKEVFFDGNLDDDSEYSYLLPLKDNFFQFYTNEDLRTRKLGGKPMIELNEIIGGVEVILRIPVNKNNGSEFIEYRRVYFESIQPNIPENDGAVVKSDFSFALFPNIKFEKEENAYYRFGLITPNGTNEVFTATFYNKNEKHKNIEPVLRNNKNSKTYGLNTKKIDHIEIKDERENTGMIVPKFLAEENSSNTTQFTFAVDLGTTNTHIEYNVRTIEKKPFDVENKDIQVCVSNKKDDYLKLEVEKDFIPEIIGENGREKEEGTRYYKFPVRTALSLLDNLDDNKSISPFVQANIAIPYQKLSFGTTVKTQLKWNTDRKQLQYFIDSLCFMMRNKVLLNNGKLDETKIVWFYPLSMQGQRMKKLEAYWSLAYAKYFLGIDANSYEKIRGEKRLTNLIPLTESEAPYLYYKTDAKKHTANIADLVSIDIGGGTTDVVFVKEKGEIEYMTSFRFAANDIFGLGNETRGMIDKYIPKIEEIITKYDKNAQLYKLFADIRSEKNKDNKNKNIATGDIASFFFSLLDNEVIKQQDIDTKEIDLHYILKNIDDEQKIIFVFFYAAIIYHIAQILKAKDLNMPRHITFSGNGSRLVTVAGEIEVLEKFSKLIFEKVGVKNPDKSKLEIIHNTKNPKEVSAKGGINAANKNYQPLDVKFKTLVLLGTDNLDFADDKTYENISENRKKYDNYVKNTIFNSKQFFENIFEILTEKYTDGRTDETFVEALGINSKAMKIAKDVLWTSGEKDFKTWTEANGIEKRMSELDDKSQKIEETFFFYPLIGFLQVLSSEIEKSDKQ